jgi:hypothetical protein
MRSASARGFCNHSAFDMAALRSDFDWTASPAHIDLLSKFVSPRDLNQILRWQYLQQSLNEDPKDAIERFAKCGLLLACDLDEIVQRAFSASDLKQMAASQSLITTGSKREIADRLLSFARSTLEQATRSHRFFRCSEEAQKFLDDYDKRREDASKAARQECHNLLLQGNARDAYKVYAGVQHKYVTAAFRPNPFDIERLDFVLSSSPRVVGDMPAPDLAILRAAAGMQLLWRDKSLQAWLPEHFSLAKYTPLIAANYLICNAEIRRSIQQIKGYATKARFVFNDYDIESCKKCLSLKEKVFALEEIPELPLESCTSETGCKCRVEVVQDYPRHFRGGVIEVKYAEDEEDDTKEENAFNRLSELKRMFDNGLITEEEFLTKKAQILADL